MLNTQKNSILKHRTQHLPVALTGLSLGISGLATALDLILRNNINCNYTNFNGWWISIPLIFIATVIVLLITFKHILHPKILMFDARNSLASSFLPTYSMTIMCIGGFLAGWQYHHGNLPPLQIIGAILLCIGVIVQIIFICFFSIFILKKHKWHNDSMYGSWFVPMVGISTASTFAGRFNNNILPLEFFQAIWFFAFISFLILFPIITYSLLFKKKCDTNKFPSIAVNFAPPNLLLASFCQSFAIPSLNPNTTIFDFHNNKFINIMLIILISFGFVYTIILYLFIIRIFKINKFDYIFASITFPLAIGCIATTNVSMYFDGLYNKFNAPFIFQIKNFFQILGYICTFIATILIIYIMIKFFIKAWHILFTNKLDNVKHQCYCKKGAKND